MARAVRISAIEAIDLVHYAEQVLRPLADRSVEQAAPLEKTRSPGLRVKRLRFNAVNGIRGCARLLQSC
jgi:hypothetical protein